MEELASVFEVPAVLRVLCYLGAMGVFAAEILWLSRCAYGRENPYSLKKITYLWLLRVLVGCVFLSLAHMLFIQGESWQPGMMLPEIALLLLVCALDLISFEERPLDWKYILTQRLPRGVMMVFVVCFITCALWVLAFVMGWVVMNLFAIVRAPEWLPFFTMALLWNAPLVFLFVRIGARDGGADLKFYMLLGPILMAYFLILLPDIIEHVVNRLHEIRIENMNKPIPRI